ncbi:PP2C family protein-serine/threonine phosphatase [Butyricicoccus pullicaecorum]|uniref:PPM-type phosphatase domain-containing protein n=1 Tax=Butyricicoccus pullicaecorum 1.2 TaxID=1203606 RepID=R8VTK3_9FIRM|nr:protein phosphatase 2C domain-containing protein [Butyricicoccus pullicaecorum]EOQ35586.1 hypothetical protein HMPREF1526_03053 [Butyricicoccus pullicaecorum 1.2]SKA67428.1 Serine/threonine protein phosphatase PrpC [Butyricicoccus pullicaecorum DSM 23266]
MEATYFFDSQVGGREDNQDCGLFYAFPFPQPVSAFILADGMGGLSHGADCARSTAAALCAELLYALYPTILAGNTLCGEDVARALKTSMCAAADRVYEAGRDRMSAAGSTLTAALLTSDSLVVGVIGDSPAYLVEDSHAQLLTPLHNLAFSQGITPNMPGYAQASCRLTQCIGTRPGDCLTPALYTCPRSSLSGRVLLLGSDGAFGALTDVQIGELVQSLRDQPHAVIPALFAAARQSGSTDNQTLFTVFL